MVNDHLSNLVAQIKNGYHAKRDEITVAPTKTVKAVLTVLEKYKYIKEVNEKEGKLVIGLRYENGEPAIMGMRRMSKPGARYFIGVRELPRVWGGLGINILSTPAGIMAGTEAKKARTGGELLAQVW